jgi:hypothetical protein
MLPLLKNVKKSDIIAEPYPHIVVRNVLDKELADYILNNFPTLGQVDHKAIGLNNLSIEEYPENKIFCAYGKDMVKDPALDARVKEFFQAHASYEFFEAVVNLFEDYLKADAPKLLEYAQSIKRGETGFIHEQYEEPKKLLIDGGFCLGTPARTRESRPSIHLDHPKKVFGALLYLKQPEDYSPGGAFNMYGVPKTKLVANPKMVIKPEYTGAFDNLLAKSLPYEHNTLLIFLNSDKAFHAVEPRYDAKHLRYTVNLAFNVDKPMFDFSKYQESVLSRKLRSLRFYIKKLFNI